MISYYPPLDNVSDNVLLDNQIAMMRMLIKIFTATGGDINSPWAVMLQARIDFSEKS